MKSWAGPSCLKLLCPSAIACQAPPGCSCLCGCRCALVLIRRCQTADGTHPKPHESIARAIQAGSFF
eukprot:5388780-Alexandrium_andersonii.AAC.1